MSFDLSAPYDVEESDVPFAKPAGLELLARLYRPKNGAMQNLPALVDVHGGAWNTNDRTVGAQHGRGLAACGLVVVSLDFRQGPDHQHPAASADIAAGIRWVRVNAARLGIDPRRVGICGSSSGGQLALLAAVKPGAKEHQGTPILLPNGSLDASAGDESVAYAIALYPVADPLARYRYAQSRKDETGERLTRSSQKYFGDERAMEQASITRILSSGEAAAVPPLWLAQPEIDDNVPAAITEACVNAWKKAGGHVEHVHVPNARHGFITKASPETEKSIALMREFIGRQLGKE